MVLGISNQYWDYTNPLLDSEWKDDNIGFSIYLNGEKQLLKYIQLRPEIGYIQKGFSDEVILTDEYGSVFEKITSSVILHDLAINLVLKVTPFESKLKPYLICGLQGNYMLAYKDYEIKVNGENHGLYKNSLDKFNEFTLNALVGIGLNYNNLVCVELEYIPAITKNYDTSLLKIKDRCFGVLVGLNISRVLKLK